MAELSLKKLKQATMPYMSMVDSFHDNVVKNKLARKNKDGSITTVFSTGVKFNNKIYEVPGYDPSTGNILSEKEVNNKFLPLLKNGSLQKTYGDFGIPVENYNTILNLYQNYKKNSNYGNVPSSSIKFNLTKKEE
mgnify:CR=1 FL=1